MVGEFLATNCEEIRAKIAVVLSTAQILFALARLGELSYREHIQLDVFMVGGGAIAIGYGTRESTHDVDRLSSFLKISARFMLG